MSESYFDKPFHCGTCGAGFNNYGSLEHHQEEECAPDLCRRCKREPVYQNGRCYACDYYGH